MTILPDMKSICFLISLCCGLTAYSQQNQCCTIIDISKEAGTFTIRDIRSGRIQTFKPEALEGAELKVGDSVGALFDSMKVVAVNGTARTYQLLDASAGDSCCIIVKVDTIEDAPVVKITAKNNSTGENIYFNVPKPLASSLNGGETVFTQASHGYAMIATQSDSTRRRLFGFPLLQEKPGQR